MQYPLYPSFYEMFSGKGAFVLLNQFISDLVIHADQQYINAKISGSTMRSTWLAIFRKCFENAFHVHHNIHKVFQECVPRGFSRKILRTTKNHKRKLEMNSIFHVQIHKPDVMLGMLVFSNIPIFWSCVMKNMINPSKFLFFLSRLQGIVLKSQKKTCQKRRFNRKASEVCFSHICSSFRYKWMMVLSLA